MSAKSPFFRFSRILSGFGYFRGRKEWLIVHGLFFSFGHPKAKRMRFVSDHVEEIYNEEATIYGNFKTIQDGEEVEEVTSDEAKGVGFYQAVFLVNDSEHEKVDLRFGF